MTSKSNHLAFVNCKTIKASFPMFIANAIIVNEFNLIQHQSPLLLLIHRTS